MGTNSGFSYLPLTTPTQTRILILAPGEKDDPIRCFRLTIDLDDDWRLQDGNRKSNHPPVGQSITRVEANTQDYKLASGFTLPNLRMQQANDRTLHTFQRYTALSYVWGCQNDLQAIFLDGKPFYVGQNLYHALMRLRRQVAIIDFSGTSSETAFSQRLEALQHHMSSEGRLLWVDAICINQNDIAEREAQVKLMARIYQQADHVHGDLGRTKMTEGTELLYLLRKIISAGRRCESQPLPTELSRQQKPRSNSRAETTVLAAFNSEYHNFETKDTGIKQKVELPSPSAKVLEDQDIPREDDVVWAHWRQFLNSPYFQRLWIVQEFSLANTVTLWYSNVSIDLEMVAECLQYLTRYSTNRNYYTLPRDEYKSRREASPSLFTVNGLIRQRSQMHLTDGRLTKQVCLLDMLELVGRTRATDLRDKIFGLLGMAADGPDFHHLVTYSRSAEEVYQDYAKCFIEKGQGILMLYQVDSRVSRTLDIPTWVPDWSRGRDEISLYDAVTTTPDLLAENKALKMQCFGSKVVLKGRLVDRVKRLSGVLPSAYASFDELAVFLWEGGNLLVKQRIDGERAVEIILETLMCGVLEAKPPAEADSLREGLAAIFGHATFLINGGEDDNSPWLPHMRKFLVKGLAYAPGRRWCITKHGKFGLVPGGTKKGDRVALFGNHCLPFLLRADPTQRCDSSQEVDKTTRWNLVSSWRLKLNKARLFSNTFLNPNTAYALVGHGYFHHLDETTYHDSKHEEAQEIVLV